MDGSPITVSCSNCSFENPEDAKFCQNCGEPLLRACPDCSTLNPAEVKFCKNCGSALISTKLQTLTPHLQALQGAAPQGIQDKLRTAKAEIDGERKPVTILFADIVGSTSIAEKLDPEEWKEIVSGAHQRMGEAIYRYEGTIAQLLGDGLLAFFGAPITHEDDPIRAVHAALDMQDAIEDYEHSLIGILDQFQMRIGINSGTVVIGDIGIDLHVEYLAIGDAVNIAARLQSAAEPGKVLLSENCAHLVRATFDLIDLGEIEVKGKADPLAVYEVTGVKPQPESGRGIEGLTSALVGRERELAELQTALASLQEGHGQIIALLGEAGIGKSRLLEEVKALSEEKPKRDSSSVSPSPIHWLEGRSLSYGSGLSFWTITQLLLADLGLSAGDPEARIKVALRRRVNDLFGGRSTEVLPFLSNLLGLKQEKEAEQLIQRLDGEPLKRQIMTSACDYFAKTADESPVVLVFEDTHWIDPSSLEALENLLSLADRAPILILLIMRIDRDHASWGIKLKAETDYAHRYSEIHLKRLSSTESDLLVNSLLEIAELPDTTRELIMARSEGNPFYLEEIIRNLIERGDIVHEGQTWRATTEISEVTIPDTLHGVLLARIDRLEEEVRSTLQMASVIGKSFHYRLLEAIAEAESQLDSHLSQLQRVDLVREKARWPELEYIFKHSLSQQAAYESLLVERRKTFHLRVGEAIEELFHDREQEFYGLLAHHFEAADTGEKAVDYLLRAGDKARLEDAHREATGYYQRALGILTGFEDDARAARTWLKLGLIHQSNFEFNAAHEAYESAFELEQKRIAESSASDRIKQESKAPPKTLHFTYPGHPGTLDPCKMHTTLQGQLVSQLFAGLGELDPETNVVPHVARSWEVLDGGRRYLFHLREDVRWSDGTPVTAKDFEWAWIRNLTLGAEAYIPSLLDDVVGAREYRLGQNTDSKSVGVRALDPTTLEVRLNKPVAYFIYLVTQPATFPLPRVVVEQYGEDWWRPGNLVSNGAFQLARYDHEGATLTRNPNYFAEFLGNLEHIKIWFTSNEETKVQEYLEEKVDVTWNVATKLIPGEVPLGEIHYPSHYLFTGYASFAPNQPPVDDLRVRKALAHALDRTRLVEVGAGPGIPAASGGVIPAGMAGHSPEIGLRHDIELARGYLAEAGYPGGRDFPTLVFSVWESPFNAEISRQWQEALGIEIRYHIRSFGEGWEGETELHGISGGWVADYPDPDSFLRQSFIYSNLRDWDWQDAHYDDLVEQAARTPDRSQRLTMYRQADRLLVSEQVLIIPLGYGGVREWADLVKPWVKNTRRNALGYMRFKDITIRQEHEDPD